MTQSGQTALYNRTGESSRRLTGGMYGRGAELSASRSSTAAERVVARGTDGHSSPFLLHCQPIRRDSWEERPPLRSRAPRALRGRTVCS